MSNLAGVMVEIPGYFPVEGVAREEYRDFVGQRVALAVVRCDLAFGNYPPGLILQDRTGAYQVFGAQGARQWIRPLVEVVRIRAYSSRLTAHRKKEERRDGR